MARARNVAFKTLALAGEETRMNRTLVAELRRPPAGAAAREPRSRVVGSLQEAAAEKSRAAQKIIDAELALAKLQAG